MLQDIADTLGNTPTMCRKCYVNPVVVDAFLAGELRDSKLGSSRKARARLLQLLGRTPGGVGLVRAFRRRTAEPARAR